MKLTVDVSGEAWHREFLARRQEMLRLAAKGGEIVETTSRRAWAADLAGYCIGRHGDALLAYWLVYRGSVQAILSRLRRSSRTGRTAFQSRHDTRIAPRDEVTIGVRAKEALRAGFAALDVFDPAAADFGAGQFAERNVRFSSRWNALVAAIAQVESAEASARGTSLRQAQSQRAKLPRGRIDTDDGRVSMRSLVGSLANTRDSLGDFLPPAEVWDMFIASLSNLYLHPDEHRTANGTPEYVRCGNAVFRYQSFRKTLQKARSGI